MAEEFLLVILNLYVRIKILVATFDTNHSVIDMTQSIAASIQKLPDVQSSQSAERAIDSRRVR
jgi:hypothetical protein